MSKNNETVKDQNKDAFRKLIVERLKNNRNTVNRFLGYESRTIPPIINKKIEEELNKIEKYLDIEYEYKIFDEDGHYSAFIIYTVGNEIQHLITSYTEDTESIRAMIMDKLSIVALDEIKDFIINEIENRTELYVVKELYPGTKKFPLENQKTILKSMERIKKIKINEYYQFNPIKSVALKLELSKKSKVYSRCEECENPCELHHNQWEKYKELYYKDREAFHSKVKENTTSFYEDMYKILRELSHDTLMRYREEGISDEIYYESMSDIDVWAEDYKQKHGRYGIEEFKWVEKSIDMQVFKLGRLQFEKIEDKTINHVLKGMGITDQVLVIDTHIQAGTPLDFHMCQESYKKAAEFFSNREKKYGTIVFVCDSWLLNSKLSELLDSESNIVKFQKQYKMVSENVNNRQLEKRVFGALEVDPKNYSAKTTLQKKLRKALVQGEKFGTARGIYIYN